MGAVGVYSGPVEIINAPYKVIQPRRFDVIVKLNGVTWRRVQVEVSPEEGSAGAASETVAPPSLAGFGLPTPDYLVGLQLRYQIAQKVHAASDPHDPPNYLNDRAHDVVDLVLIHQMAATVGHPQAQDIREAITDIFDARAAEAVQLGREPRHWPARLVAYPHWTDSFKKAAAQANLSITLTQAVTLMNKWLSEIDPA